jgi:hypothetical protein
MSVIREVNPLSMSVEFGIAIRHVHYNWDTHVRYWIPQLFMNLTAGTHNLNDHHNWSSFTLHVQFIVNGAHLSTMSSMTAKHKLSIDFFSSYQLNAHFLYSVTIYLLHYNPQHVSSNTLLIFRRTNCIITAFGIVTLCKSPLSTGILYGRLQRVTILKAVIIQFVLLKMSKVLLETC